MTTTAENLMAEAAAAAAAVVVVARANSPQTNGRRMTKRREAETAIGSKSEIKHLLFKLTPVPIYCYSFCIRCVYVVLSVATKTAPRALCLISHIPRRF